MNVIEIIAITITTGFIVFAFGPKFITLCESFAELLVDATGGWFFNVIDSWAEFFKRWFNKK